MKLTTVYVTLLVISHISWTIADSTEEVLLWNKDFGPCAVTLIPEGPCRQEQDGNTCAYIFNLPPLTLHLPKQLRELEKIVQDVQSLKDKVDELRKMCADCTVSQSERECGREREHEKLNEGKDNHNDMRDCRNNTNPNGPKDSKSEFGTDRVKVEGTVEGQGDTDSGKKNNSEEKDRKKAERESNIRIIKKGTLKVVHKKDVKTQRKIEGRQGNDQFGLAKVPGFGQNDTIDISSEKVSKNNSKIVLEVNKENDGKGNSKGNGEDMLENREDANTRDAKNNEKLDESSHNIWRAGTKDKEKQTQGEEDRVSDRIKMSVDHGEDTNEEQEQHREEREKEMEQEIQTERHNKKPKDTESITRAETEKTIKKGEEGEKGTEIKTTVQTVQRDSDGELASGKVTQKKDVVSLRPNPHAGPESTDSDRPQTFTSLTNTITQFNTEVSQGMAINEYGFTTENVGLGYGKTGIPEHLNTGEDFAFRTTTTKPLISPFVSPTKNVISSSRLRLGPDYQGPESLATSTETTTANSNIYGTPFPQITEFSHWSTTKNISTNTKQPKPGDKLKPEIKPKVLQKQNSEYDPKRNRPPLPDKRPAHAQKQKPSHQKPITGQKNTKDSKNVQNPKSDQRPLTQNLKHNKTLEYDGEDEQTQIRIQKPKFYQPSTSSTQKRILQYKPGTVNTNSSDINPVSYQEPKYAGSNQSSKSEQTPSHPLDTHNPEQQQKLDKKSNEGKSTFGQRLISNQTSPFVQEPDPQTATFTPKPDLNPITELMKIFDKTFSPKENPKFGQKLKPIRGNIPPEYRPKPSQKISKINQKAKLPQIHVTDPDVAQSTKHNQTHPQPIQPDQAPQTNLRPKMPDQKSKLNIKSVRNQEPEAESVKKYKPRPPPRNKIPVRPRLKPPVTPLQTPKPVMQPKKTQKTKTLDPLQTNGITPDSVQNSDRDTSSTSSPVRRRAKVNNSQVDRDFSPSTMKTVTMGQETLNSLLVGPPPHLHPVQEVSTMSPNSRITSDLKPQTADQPSSILMTPSPNKISDEILSHMIPKTSLVTSNSNQATDSDSRLEENIVLKVEETTNLDTTTSSILPSSPQSSSTVSYDSRSTNSVISNFEATAATPLHQESTPSPRELRVKISQLAAFFNNSQNPNGGSPDSHPKQHPKENKGGSQPDGTRRKLSTLIPSKVNKERRDCSDHLVRGERKSGVYQVTPHLGSRSFTVFCDMEQHGGGWTVLQRRQDGSVSFNRTWEEYRSGFGELNGGEFWLGNHLIHLLTWDRDMMLRVELEDFDGFTGYAEYAHFRVANERTHFRLTVGGYSGTAGDALRFSKRYDHNNRAFTTPDKDQDRYPSGNCGAYYSSGWWFDACMAANLNGKYYVGRYKGIRDGIFWGTWQNITKEYYPTSDRQSFKSVRMMIRPKGFAP